MVYPRCLAQPATNLRGAPKDETNKQFAVPGEGPVVKIVVEDGSGQGGVFYHLWVLTWAFQPQKGGIGTNKRC